MEATKHDILDLVAVTVGNICSGSFSDDDVAIDVQLSGDNILIGSKPIPISTIRACSNSVKKFLNLIKKTLK